MKATCAPVPVTSGEREMCYACLREFHPDDLGGCMVCGENLCLDFPTCSGRCRCDEERIGNTHLTNAVDSNAMPASL